jgi:hypothetical protein
MRRSLLCAIVVAALAAVPAAYAGKFDSVVRVLNNSMWNIHEMYLSSVDTEEWGPDQLGEDVIESGGSFQLNGVPCDSYDVRLVDEDGDVCVIGGVDLCASQHEWEITDEDLLACQVVTEE